MPRATERWPNPAGSTPFKTPEAGVDENQSAGNGGFSLEMDKNASRSAQRGAASWSALGQIEMTKRGSGWWSPAGDDSG